MTTWGELKPGDIIRCGGHEERVVFVRPHLNNHVFVRTSRHDHARPADQEVDNTNTEEY
jgi:hypothetical protein